MILAYLRRSGRPVSVTLLLCFVFEFAAPLHAGAAGSGGGTIASSLSGMVDGYTGDFRYSVPLVTVPGPNGESVSVTASYRAGVSVHQKASWVGLGWDYNPGEISRQVIDAPDDYNGANVNQYTSENLNPALSLTNPNWQHSSKVMAKFGSIYNNQINTNVNNPYSGATGKEGDNQTVWYSLTASERNAMITQANNGYNNSLSLYDPTANGTYRFNRHTVPYTSLAYDRYSVSGEGIGGSIHPYHLGQVKIHSEMGPSLGSEPVGTKKCQFYFESSTAVSVDESNIGNAAVVNQSTNRIHSGTFVKYFTNAEINNNSNLYDAAHPSGYLDYQPIVILSATRRPSPDYPADGIGAFQITNPAGVTYHYSLPVYDLKSLSCSFGDNRKQLTLMNQRYASSWKLTAITGPDYEDTNGNHTADEGDSGYWVAYNYSLWSSDYEWASQRYNARTDAMISPKMINLITSAAVANKYERNSSLSFGNSQVYVLNYIRTATHTAYFVKSIREDEQSYSNIMNTSVKPVASLKLDRVVLLPNKDKGLLINNISLSGADLDSRFEYSTCSTALADRNFVNITRYNAYKMAIDAAALSTAELNYNYALAKKYTGNINNSFSSTATQFNVVNIAGHVFGSNVGSWYKTLTGYTGTTASGNNGKLTLKKISHYGLQGTKVSPSVDFSYDEASTTKNPDFDGDKTDLWGYYKSDYVNSHYVTAVSKDHVDAWSLKEIDTPLGGKIQISYESDRYHREGFSGDPPFYKIQTGVQMTEAHANMPSLIFPISNITSGGAVSFYDHDISTFVNFVNEPVGDPSYEHPMYAIYSQIEECFHPLVSYNNGNSSYYPPVYRQVVRYGTTFTNGTTGSGTGPYNTMLAGSQPEFQVNCNRPGYSLGSTVSNNAGVNHAVVFRSYLYGGGVRVSSLKITDPFSGNSYTQKFEYGKGYCPVVPKPNDFSTYSGPSNHDVAMNMRPATAPQLTGLVGYDYCTQYAVDNSSHTTSRATQEFNNDLLMKPLRLVIRTPFIEYRKLCQAMGTPLVGNCYAKPTGSSDFLCNQYLTNHKIALDLRLFNGSLLGKLKSVSNGVTTTKYTYAATSVKESYLHPRTERVTYSGQVLYPPTAVQNAIHDQCLFPYDYWDEYTYNASDVYNASYFLASTETEKDGITIREDMKRLGYTAAPYYTKTTDPTRGVFEATSSYAFLATQPGSSTRLYPAMDMKSKNEDNRNLLTAVCETRTEKDGRYVISQSKATYTNVYTLRSVSGSTSTVTKPWYHLHESYERLLDDDVLLSAIPTSADWRKTSVGTLYDKGYNCIEQQGLNGRYTASRWGYDGLFKLADISNANYNSFTFSGFEDPVTDPVSSNLVFGGEVLNGQTSEPASLATVNQVTAMIRPHTGSRLAGLNPNAAGPVFQTTHFDVGRTYVAKVWVHKLSPPTAALTILADDGSFSDTKTITRNDPSNVPVGDWVLMRVELEIPAYFSTAGVHQLSVSLSNANAAGKAWFDDLAVHPRDAAISGNVYDPKTGLLMAQLDNDHFATFYTYDDAMRLKSASKEYSGGIKKITESTYHYAKP